MTNKPETNLDHVLILKRTVMSSAMYTLRRIVDAHDGIRLPTAPEEDFDDVLLTLNVAIAKLDAIDAHPSGTPDLVAVDAAATAAARSHLRVVE